MKSDMKGWIRGKKGPEPGHCGPTTFLRGPFVGHASELTNISYLFDFDWYNSGTRRSISDLFVASKFSATVTVCDASHNLVLFFF